MDAADRDLFARSLRDATSRHSGAALDAALADLGWHDALATDARDAVSILFELQGTSNATSSALAAVLLDGLGWAADGVVLPALGQRRAPATRAGHRVVVDGLALAPQGRLLVAVTRDDTDGESDDAVIVDAALLDVQPVGGIDPSLGLQRVRGDLSATDAHAVDWGSAVARGQRAIAHELIGASRTMLELARTHALEREQFGRPIAMFQAVRHRLAETLVAIETAEALLDAAWLDATPVNAAMAKACAGRSARTAARHCQQVLAGIGFTTEHPLHRYVRRALVLDQLLGSSKRLTEELGVQLLTTKELPPLLAL
jgi:hypothetical protein